MDNTSSKKILISLEKFFERSSLLVKESILNDKAQINSFKKNFKNILFYSETLKELNYIDTEKGKHLMRVLHEDSLGQRRWDFDNYENELSFVETQLKNRANFIYLHSLFERILIKIFKYGFLINPDFKKALKGRFKLKYDDLTLQKKNDEALTSALFDDESKLPDLIGKLDYTPLYNLIELLNLRKGHFKEFIEVSYEIDVYRVIRNSIAHRDDTTDEIFHNEIDNIKGVRGRLGDVKNKKFKSDLLKRILSHRDVEKIEKKEQVWLKIRGSELMRCFINFIQISSIAIILLEEEKTNVAKIREIFASSFIHDFLHAFHKSRHVKILDGCLEADLQLEKCFELLNKTIDEINSRKGKDQSEEQDDFSDVYLVNKLLLLNELEKNGEKPIGAREAFDSLLIKISDENISKLTRSYLDDDIQAFVNQMRVLDKEKGDSISLENWYMVITKLHYEPVRSFIELYLELQRIQSMKGSVENSKKIQKASKKK